MAPTKRKTTRKSVSTNKPVKKRTAGKRGVGSRRKSLVADVVTTLEHTLEALPKKIRKTAKKVKTAAAKNRVVKNVVAKLEETPKKSRKGPKKKSWRV